MKPKQDDTVHPKISEGGVLTVASQVDVVQTSLLEVLNAQQNIVFLTISYS